MVMKKLDIRLLRLVKYNRGPFISISIMIILALTIYISLSMVADNLNSTIFHYYDVTNFGDIFVEVSKVPKKVINELSAIDGIEKVQGRISADVPLRVKNPKEKVNVRIVSIPNEDYVLNDIFLIDGKVLKNSPKSTMVLQQFFHARNMNLGNRIVPYIKGREYPMEIVGVVGSPEYIYLMENEQALLPAPEKFGILYVSEEFAQSTLDYQGTYNEIIIKVEDNYKNKIDSIIDEIEEELDKYIVKKVVKREGQLSHSVMMEEVEQLENMAASITLLFLIVSAIIINIMLSRMVRNDRMSIGVMKALGYSNFNILIHYAKFSVLIGLVGSIIGAGLSIPLSTFMTSLYIQYMNIPMFKMEINYIYFAYGILLTVIFCILSGMVGARNVIKILPADAMRAESPKTGKRIWIEDIKFIWNRMSFSWKMVVRNIFRNKKRGIFLVLGIALTYGITMVPIFMMNVWDNLFDIQYGELQRMDYNIDFAVPMNHNAIRELIQVADIDYIEPKVEIPLELKRGWLKNTVNIIGLKRDTELYFFKDIDGNEIKLPKDGILLSKIVADNLHAEVGDKIIVKNLILDREDKTLEVKGIVEQYLGSNGYMDIDEINKLLEEKQVITGAILNSSSNLEEKLQNVKNIRQIQSIEDMKNAILEFIDIIIYFVGVMMIFGGVLGFAIVYNVTIVGIGERAMEFSSLRVMGFDKKEIYGLVTKENTIMTFWGLLAGVPLGYGMCKVLVLSLSADMYSIPLIIKPSSYIITAISTIIFIALAQLATIRKIYHLNFIDSLKNRIS